MPNLSGDHMLLFDAGGEGSFSLAVPVAEAGTYRVKVHYVRARDYGRVQLAVNGAAVGGPVDTYLERDDLVRPIWPPREYRFSGIHLRRGENVFTFSVADKNPASRGFKVGLDCLVLEKEGS
jgi:hypothetical protein